MESDCLYETDIGPIWGITEYRDFVTIIIHDEARPKKVPYIPCNKTPRIITNSFVAYKFDCFIIPGG